MDTFWDVFLERFMMWFLLPVTLALFVGLIIALPFMIWFEVTHHCTKWTMPYYHSGYFSGKVYIPGGTWSDCVEYTPNG